MHFLRLPLLAALAITPFAWSDEPLRIDDENPLSAASWNDLSTSPVHAGLWTRAGSERFQQDFEAFVPLATSAAGDKLFFTNFVFNYRDGGEHSFSGGIGTRHYLPGANAVLGLHLHGDFTETIHDNQFAQFGIGFDLFTETGIDFRGNLYFPESGPDSIGGLPSYATPFGRRNSILQYGLTRYEAGLRGGDFQVEFDVPLASEILPTRGHLGVYHFESEFGGSLTGAKAGIAVHPCEGVSVGAEYYGDEEFFGNHWVFVAGLSAPFTLSDLARPGEWFRSLGDSRGVPAIGGSRSTDEVRSMLYSRIDRRNWVLTDISDPLLTQSKMNELLSDVIFVNNGSSSGIPKPKGTGKGTYENPASSIQRGINLAARKFGNSGNIVVAGVKDRYREDLLDAGKSVRLYGGGLRNTGTGAFRYGPKRLPSLHGGIRVTDVNDFTMMGFRVIRGGTSFVNPDAIFAGNVGDVYIGANRIRKVFQDGIDIEVDGNNRSQVLLAGNRINLTFDDAFDFDIEDKGRVTFLLRDNRTSRNSSDSVEFDIEDNARVRGQVVNNHFTRTGGEGIEVDQDDNSRARIRFLGNRITRTGDDPIDIDLNDTSRGSYQVANNMISGFFPGSDVDIDSEDSSTLMLQIMNNRSTNDFNFDEFGASTFLLENSLNTNTLTRGAVLDIDPSIRIVPRGKFGFQEP